MRVDDPGNPTDEILLAVVPVDFRKGIDGLTRVCTSVIGSDPMSGYLFVRPQ